jgi:hypothetical protein
MSDKLLGRGTQKDGLKTKYELKKIAVNERSLV